MPDAGIKNFACAVVLFSRGIDLTADALEGIKTAYDGAPAAINAEAAAAIADFNARARAVGFAIGMPALASTSELDLFTITFCILCESC